MLYDPFHLYFTGEEMEAEVMVKVEFEFRSFDSKFMFFLLYYPAHLQVFLLPSHVSSFAWGKGEAHTIM